MWISNIHEIMWFWAFSHSLCTPNDNSCQFICNENSNAMHWRQLKAGLNNYTRMKSILNLISLCPKIGIGFRHDIMLGRQRRGTAERAMCVPFNCSGKAWCAVQLYACKPNVWIAGGWLQRRLVLTVSAIIKTISFIKNNFLDHSEKTNVKWKLL